MNQDLTQGNISKAMLAFALPMMLGNLLQQCYNIADTLIVGRFLGADALAAVGSAYTLMTFLTSVQLGLSMGSGAVFSMRFGERDWDGLKSSAFAAFLLIGLVTVALNVAAFLALDPILRFLKVPAAVYPLMRAYVWIVLAGLFATFLYNYFASLLRAVGNSVVPLVFLGIAAALNIGLDLLFVLSFHWGVQGAAAATVAAQYVSGAGILIYTLCRVPRLRPSRRHLAVGRETVKELSRFSLITCLQQSVMNFGILMVQGLVNSFGPAVMAAFAAAVKIDSFAYMPVQDFGNAFSTFVAQNYGAKRQDRINRGVRSAVIAAAAFCVAVTAAVCLLARPLMLLFVSPSETEILRIGVQYLRIEGAFYLGIGCLFLLYGFYRAVGRPGMSFILTVISLGTRVALAYLLSGVEAIGVAGVWWSVPIGWLLADAAGIGYYLARYRKKQPLEGRA